MVLTLIGYRATGKTCIAQSLGAALGWEAIDADVEIERRAGKTIKLIFEEDGEPAFRDLEAEVIADLCKKDQLVIASGGGAPMREVSRKAMAEAGKVIWLRATPETILARMTGDVTTAERRPDLTDRGGLQEIIDMLELREPIYRETADFEVDTEQKSIEAITGEILERIR